MCASWLDHHRVSERLASEAQLRRGREPPDAVVELYREAAEAEEAALAEIEAGKARTRGTIGVSAAALWYKAGDQERLERIARNLLSDGTLPGFARSALNEMVRDMSVRLK